MTLLHLSISSTEFYWGFVLYAAVLTAVIFLGRALIQWGWRDGVSRGKIRFAFRSSWGSFLSGCFFGWPLDLR